MIALGFMNGYIIAYGLYLEKELRLNKKLQEAIDRKFEADQEIDELNERYSKLLEKYTYYSTLIYKLNNDLSKGPVDTSGLPPLPVSPLARCNSPYYNDDISTPSTPTSVLSSTD